MPERRRRAGRCEQLPPPDFTPEAAAPQPAPIPAPSLPAQPQQPELPPADAPVPPARDLVATNTGVRLACTMSAMIGLFAIFLCWAERESRVIRRFSVQSAALTAVHAVVGVGALLFSGILGAIPYFGLMVKLVCLLGYIAVLILLIVARIRLMQRAWQGVRFTLPRWLEGLIARYY